MRFDVLQRFRHPAAVVAAAYANPALYPFLSRLPKLGVPEVLERTSDGRRVRLKVRYRFGGELSATARRVIDPTKLSWVDESDHDLDEHTVAFVLHPDHFARRFKARGTYRFVDDADGNAVRTGEVEVKVSFPVVGPAVEQAIASGLREHLDDEVDLVATFIDGLDR